LNNSIPQCAMCPINYKIEQISLDKKKIMY
jgi:hypothetical protein